MKFRLFVIPLLSLSLLVTSSPAYSARPPKDGAACTKLGAVRDYQGKSFKCSKNGNKLVWKSIWVASKRVESSKEVLQIEKQIDLITKALKVHPVPKYDLSIEPIIKDGVWLQASKSGIDASLKFLREIGFEFKEVPGLLIFRNFEWAKSSMSGSCLRWGESSPGGACQSETAFVNLGWFEKRNFKRDNFAGIFDRLEITTAIPVALFHIAQSETYMSSNNTSNPGTLNDIPAWLSMGKMQFVKATYMSILTGEKYSKIRRELLEFWGNRCTRESLRKLSDIGPYESSCEWINGMLALELLLSQSQDFRSLFWWERKAKGTVPESFQEAYGMEWETFLDRADSYIKAQNP